MLPVRPHGLIYRNQISFWVYIGRCMLHCSSLLFLIWCRSHALSSAVSFIEIFDGGRLFFMLSTFFWYDELTIMKQATVVTFFTRSSDCWISFYFMPITLFLYPVYVLVRLRLIQWGRLSFELNLYLGLNLDSFKSSCCISFHHQYFFTQVYPYSLFLKYHSTFYFWTITNPAKDSWTSSILLFLDCLIPTRLTF